MLETPEFMTRREAAEALEITTVTLWRWQQDGIIKPVKIGKRSRYRASDVRRILNPDPANE